MPAQVHFATFVEVLMAATELGMTDAEEISRVRVKSWRRDLEAMVTRLIEYLQLHFMLLQPYETRVRNLPVPAIILDIQDSFHDLTVQADALHRSFPDGWKKVGDDVRRERCLVINKSAPYEIPNLRVLPLGSVVTSNNFRIISDLSFDFDTRNVKGGLNADTDVDPRAYLCAEA